MESKGSGTEHKSGLDLLIVFGSDLTPDFSPCVVADSALLPYGRGGLSFLSSGIVRGFKSALALGVAEMKILGPAGSFSPL